MSNAEQAFQRKKNSLENDEELTEKEKQIIKNDFIHELRNAEDIESGHSFARHIQKLRNITRYNTWNLAELETEDITEDFNKTIRDQIQDSDYKKNTGKAKHYAVDTKEKHWTTWKYYLKHFHNIKPGDQEIPEASFSSPEQQVDMQADTQPQDLPTPRQFRKLLNMIDTQSTAKTRDRNVAFFLFLWDTGTRAGEALNIQMKNVQPPQQENERMRVWIKGNKPWHDDSNNRWNTIYQGHEILLDYYRNHPARGQPDAYLFPKTHTNDYESHVSKERMYKVMRKAKAAASLDFKDYGEPLHIFRKAMITFLEVNDVLDWGVICERLGKSSDATKPDYLLRALEDRELIEAKGFGLDVDENDRDGHMNGNPFMPQNCTSCGRTNSCLEDLCVECGNQLERYDLEEARSQQEEKPDPSKRIAEKVKDGDKSMEDVMQVVEMLKDMDV